jgi:hypothetical protein
MPSAWSAKNVGRLLNAHLLLKLVRVNSSPQAPGLAHFLRFGRHLLLEIADLILPTADLILPLPLVHLRRTQLRDERPTPVSLHLQSPLKAGDGALESVRFAFLLIQLPLRVQQVVPQQQDLLATPRDRSPRVVGEVDRIRTAAAVCALYGRCRPRPVEEQPDYAVLAPAG